MKNLSMSLNYQGRIPGFSETSEETAKIGEAEYNSKSKLDKRKYTNGK